MSNEELVVQAQQGNKQALKQLWEQVEKLIVSLCTRTYNRLTADYFLSRGVTLEDLQQESYFAFLQAVQAYDTDKGYKFTSYLSNHLKNIVATITGMRTAKQRGDPLNKCDSLDKPLTEDETLTIRDIIEDDVAGTAFEEVEHRVMTWQLHKALDEAMTLQCTDREKQVLEMRHYHGKTQKETSEFLGVSFGRISQIEKTAYRNLRKGKAIQILEPYRLEALSYSLSGSHRAWKEKGSVPERALEKLEKYKRLFADLEVV